VAAEVPHADDAHAHGGVAQRTTPLLLDLTKSKK
jgi:hypothetical protein